MTTSSLGPADKATRTAGVMRQLLGTIVLWGLFWFVLTARLQPRFSGTLSYLHVTSPLALSVGSVFLWRAFLAYRESGR
ncbi:hypothetical protein DWB78_13455 [Halopelagius longus]|uniref:Uncharacterized protein n=1 Tax=Halopelagius longus TaxID=1236180 RepID=A0A1H0YRV7_9EURY|nr:hypothetical protein DWB78_13455 [Halopelagius longus]SDQ17957.1 hypothetical protein SAMN05216278_0808 [Halopelagius longus]